MFRIRSIAFSLLVLIGIPYVAVQSTFAQTPSLPVVEQGEENNALGSGNLDDVVVAFGRRRGLGGRGDALCIASPGQLETIWHDRPLFIWQGSPDQLVVRDPQAQPVWNAAVASTEQQALYSGAPLQPGQTYDWWMNPNGSERDYMTFKVMATEQRQQITADLQALTSQLQFNSATSETIAVQQAQYFTDQELWADALQTLYAVENPSEALVQAQQEIVNDLCGN